MSVTHRPPAPNLPVRAAVAVGALRLVNDLSRTLGRGSGTVAGGRVGLALDPRLLTTLARGRRVVLVSGTNGKTTTTGLLAVATGAAPATNRTGANMPAGHVAALVEAPEADTAVLEVDEGYLPQVVAATRPRVVVLLNLSRDQLDRISEVRMLAERWRDALGSDGAGDGPGKAAGDGGPENAGGGPVVVANADDPLVVFAARGASEVRWVGAGQVWRHDAVGCPACGGRIRFEAGGGWACERCDLARPEAVAWLAGPDGTELATAAGGRHPIGLALPGRFNRSNAAMAAVAAAELAGEGPGDDDGVAAALRRLAAVGEVAGRFATAERRGHPVRLALAKNPAGWTAIFDLLDEEGGGGRPVVASINARVADGFDPSWLWDVPFERLAGRPVVATGDRRLDLAVRLRYAEVDHRVVEDPLAAVDAAAGLVPAADPVSGGPPIGRPAVDVIANYTAFADLRRRL